MTAARPRKSFPPPMKAIVCEQYGGPDVLQLQEIPSPEVGPGQLLIQVMASPITSADRKLRSLDFPNGLRTFGRLVTGWRGPRKRVLGVAFSGVVIEAGAKAENFQVGDRVFGMDAWNMGCHAELKVVSATGAVAHMPASLSFEQAAALPFGGTTSLHFLRKAQLVSGESVLVNGASGVCGSAAVRLATHFGASVTAVCAYRSTLTVKRLGAVHVVDYESQNITRTAERFDVIVDSVGNLAPRSLSRLLNPGGRLVRLNAGVSEMILPSHRSGDQGGYRLVTGLAAEKSSDLIELGDLATAQKFRPSIDSIFSLSEAVAAHRLAGAGGLDGAVLLAPNLDRTNLPRGQSR